MPESSQNNSYWMPSFDGMTAMKLLQNFPILLHRHSECNEESYVVHLCRHSGAGLPRHVVSRGRNLVKTIPHWSVLLLSAALAGCSLPPSEGDIKAALEASLSDTNKLSASLFGAAGKVEIVAVKKIGCTKEGGGYTCDVEVTSKVPVVGERKSMSKMRFVKLDSGWSVAQ